MSQKILRHNTVFTLDYSNIRFGPIPQDELCSYFKDGRHTSELIENSLKYEFYGLRHPKNNEFFDLYYDPNYRYDFVNVDNKNKQKLCDNFIKDGGFLYDVKCWTKNGLNFQPSSQIGTGRRFDENKFIEKADLLYYIITYIVNFPEIKLIVLPGTKLRKQFPGGKINNNIENYREIFG